MTSKVAEGKLGMKTQGGLFEYTPEKIQQLQQQRGRKLSGDAQGAVGQLTRSAVTFGPRLFIRAGRRYFGRVRDAESPRGPHFYWPDEHGVEEAMTLRGRLSRASLGALLLAALAGLSLLGIPQPQQAAASHH